MKIWVTCDRPSCHRRFRLLRSVDHEEILRVICPSCEQVLRVDITAPMLQPQGVEYHTR